MTEKSANWLHAVKKNQNFQILENGKVNYK